MTSLSVDIGGIVIALAIEDALLAKMAERRYRPFLSPRVPALTLEIAPAPVDRHSPSDSPRVDRVGDRRYELSYGALSATLDLAQRRGRALCPDTIYVIDSLLRIALTLVALDHDALLLHSSSVCVPGGAIVCFGPSGVGKSTVARSVPPESVLCDEIILLRAMPDHVRVSGTPFHGDYPVYSSAQAPARRIVRLRQSEHERLTPLSPAHATQQLLSATLFFCADESLAQRLLDLAARIAQLSPIAILDFQRGTHVPTFLERFDTAPDAPASREAARR